jgi:hypothetical protein
MCSVGRIQSFSVLKQVVLIEPLNFKGLMILPKSLIQLSRDDLRMAGDEVFLTFKILHDFQTYINIR